MEFDYLKVGDKCWVWSAKRNVTVTGLVANKSDEWIYVDVENDRALFLFDGVLWSGPSEYTCLVHAPFTANFPPKPKRKVVKEAQCVSQTHVAYTSHKTMTFQIPRTAENVKCTYEVEEE